MKTPCSNGYSYATFSCWVDTRFRETTKGSISPRRNTKDVAVLTKILHVSFFEHLVVSRLSSVHNIIKGDAVLKEVIYTGHYTEHTERKEPDSNHSNDASLLSSNEPSEEAEEGGENINK